MPTLDEKMSSMAEQVLKRGLSEDEKSEIYRISDAMGMANVQSFLYLIMLFKLHEDAMNAKFKAMSELEQKIQATLESSIEKILTDGASRMASDMSEAVTEGTKETLRSFGTYHSLRGQTVLVCFITVMAAIAYRLGTAKILNAVPSGSAFEGLLFLPAGWCVFFCGATSTFLWVGDHWGRIKKTALYKAFLGLQIFFLLILALNLL
jgi:hypothetical protein